MKKLRLLALLLVATVPFAACDDEGPVEDQPLDATISGTVLVEGSPLASVQVQLSGEESRTQVTGSNGQYEFAGIDEEGTYTVSIASADEDVTFESPSVSVTLESEGQTETVNFNASYVRTASITGTVNAGGPVEGATVELDGTETADPQTTDAEGSYTFSGLRAGNYTVSVSDLPDGVSLSTTTKSVSLEVGQLQVVDFSGVGTTPARVRIERLTIGNTNAPVNVNNTGGQIDATLEVEEGDDDVTRVELLVGDEVVAFQTFSSGGAAAEANNVVEGPEAASGQFQVVLSVQTAALQRDENGDLVLENGQAQPRWQDGTWPITARINTVNDGQAAAESSTDLVFNNSAGGWVGNAAGNTVMLSGSAPNSAIGTDNLLHHAGDVTVNGIPLSFDGTVVSQVTFGLTSGPSQTDDDGSDGYEVTFSSAVGTVLGGVGDVETGNLQASATTLTAGGDTGPGAPNTNLRNGNPLRLDNVGPGFADVDEFLRDTRWINEEWVFADKVNIPIPGVDDVDIADGGNGVGFVDDLTVWAGADPNNLAEVESGDDLDETFDNDANFLRADARDVLGNETTIWYDGTAAGDTDVPSGPNHLFGVDHGDPTLVVSDGSGTIAASDLGDEGLIDNSGAGNVLRLQPTDGRSGFDSNPVDLVINRLAPSVSGTDACAFGDTSGGACDMQADDGLFDFDDGAQYDNGMLSEAYYRAEAIARDEAGNESGPVNVLVLFDNTNSSAGGIVFSSTLTGGEQEEFSLPLSDNLDIDASEMFLTYSAFAGGGRLLFSEQAVGEFGPGEFSTSTNHSQTVEFIRSIEDASAGLPGSIEAASDVDFDVWDFHLGENTTLVNSTTALGGSVTPAGSSFNGTGSTDTNVSAVAAATSEATVCKDANGDGCTNPTSTTLSLEVTGSGTAGAEGALQNLFQNGVSFWVQRGANTSTDWKQLGTVTAVDIQDSADNTTRTYTWELDVSGTAFDFPNAGDTTDEVYNVWGVAVTADGRGLAEDVTVTVSSD